MKLNEVREKILGVMEAVNAGTPEGSSEFVFTEEAKAKIHEFAEETRETEIYKGNYKDGIWFTKGMTANQMYNHMILKITQAPTMFHSLMTPVLMMPFIDEKLREEDNE